MYWIIVFLPTVSLLAGVLVGTHLALRVQYHYNCEWYRSCDFSVSSNSKKKLEELKDEHLMNVHG